MKKYFLITGSDQEGPFDVEELKAKRITRETPIWYEGLPAWTTAGEVQELSLLISSIPPAFVKGQSSKNPNAKISSSTPNQKSSTTRRVVWGLGVILLALVVVFVFNAVQRQQVVTSRQTESDRQEDIKASIRNNITNYVTAERNQYYYSNLGGISGLRISVSNSTDYLLDNVKVKVTYIKANGDVWGNKIIDFNLVPAQTKVTLPVEDTERGVRIIYEIVSIKSNTLGL